MRYEFLVETYATERIKVVGVWSEFIDQDLPVRPSGMPLTKPAIISGVGPV